MLHHSLLPYHIGHQKIMIHGVNIEIKRKSSKENDEIHEVCEEGTAWIDS
jgi:hypothetical protein